MTWSFRSRVVCLFTGDSGFLPQRAINVPHERAWKQPPCGTGSFFLSYVAGSKLVLVCEFGEKDALPNTLSSKRCWMAFRSFLYWRRCVREAHEEWKKNDSGKERFRTIRRDVGGYLKTNNKPWTRCKISSFTYCPITFTERETHQEEHPINLGDNMHNTHSGRKKIKSKRRKLPRVSGYSNTTTSPANFLRHHS